MISTGSSERVARNGDTQTPLCDVDADGQDVLAVLPVILEVGAVADLDGIINRVESASRAPRHEVKVLADVADLVAASAVKLECPEFAGVTVGGWCAGCAIVMAVNSLHELAGSRGVVRTCGAIYVMERILAQFSTSRLLVEYLPFTIERRYVRLGWRQTGGESIAAS